MLKCGTNRSSSKCSDKVRTIREDMPEKFQLANPYDDEKGDYKRHIVDEYLSKLVIEIEDLKALLTLDAEVLEIMQKYV